MTLLELLPIIAVIFFILFTVSLEFKDSINIKTTWLFPAILSVLFLLFSLQAVIFDGIFGFWVEHISSLWGNQIWFDLLLAIAIALTLLLPQAKTLGMNTKPWLIIVVCTGCIGLLAMFARFLYLKQKLGI